MSDTLMRLARGDVVTIPDHGGGATVIVGGGDWTATLQLSAEVRYSLAHPTSPYRRIRDAS